MSGFWKILELEPTRDVSAIRRAYAQKTRNCHPEENPEEFLELRKAYQAAMDFAERESAMPAPVLPRRQEKAEKNQGAFSELRKGYQAAPEADVEQPISEESSETDTTRPISEELSESDVEYPISEETPEEDADWVIPEDLQEEGPNPFRDGEAIRQFVNLYTGKQRRNSKLWMDYFTSDAFLDAAWDSRFTALLREKVTEMEQDFPPAREFLMWLGIVYQFSVKEYQMQKQFELCQGADFQGMQFILDIAVRGPLPKRPGGDELAIGESFKDYRHLVRLAESGSWNDQAMEEFKWIADRYVSAYIKERCAPGVNPDYQRHPAGLRVFIHFFQRCDLPGELYHIVWRKYDLKSVVMGRAKIFYGSLRELVTDRVPGIEDEEPESFFRLNQDREACFARIQENPEQEKGELDAFFAREDVRKALHSRRFVEEQLLSWSNWLNRMTPESAVRRLAEFYRENRDISGWDRVVKQAEQELESRARVQKKEEEDVVPEELDLSLLLAFPERVYVQPLAGSECVFRPDKEGDGMTLEYAGQEDLPDDIRDYLTDNEKEEEGELLTEEGLLVLFDRFSRGELERLELEFCQTTLVLNRDKDKYACFCFETESETWYSMLSQPEIYCMVDSRDVEYLPFGMGKLASYNIHESPASILGSLNLVFMQIGRVPVQNKVGDRWLWASHTSLQNGRFKKHMAMQKLAKIPTSRMGDHILAKFVFSQYPARIESVALSGERTLTELRPGGYSLATAALAQFFQKKLAKLRLSWEAKGQESGMDRRHIILLQDEGRFMMAWLEDGRERADFFASDAPCVFSGRVYPACLVHRDLSRIRNCLDLILDDMTCAHLVTDRPGEFVPSDRSYALVRAELVDETGN